MTWQKCPVYFGLDLSLNFELENYRIGLKLILAIHLQTNSNVVTVAGGILSPKSVKLIFHSVLVLVVITECHNLFMGYKCSNYLRLQSDLATSLPIFYFCRLSKGKIKFHVTLLKVVGTKLVSSCFRGDKRNHLAN